MQNVELEHFINSLLLCNVLNSCLSVPSWLCRCDSLSVICCRLRQYAKRRTRAFHLFLSLSILVLLQELPSLTSTLFCYAMCSIPACLCLPGCAGAIPYQSFAVVYDNMQNVELEHFINSLLLCNVLNSCLSVPSWLCRCDSLSVICCRLRQYAKRRSRAFHQLSSAMQCAHFLPVCAFLAVQVRFLISHLLSFTTICKTSISSISSTLFCYAMYSIPACLCLPVSEVLITYLSFLSLY